MKVIQLCGLLWLEKQKFIKLYYGDGSRFSMNSYLPSAWQKKGAPIAFIPDKSTGINVFGLLGRDMDFHPYTTKDSMTSAMVIAFIDDFSKSMTMPTVIVLDNAPIHHSQEFEEQVECWEDNGLFVFYLPRYAPHLNLIETLWRKIKYEWLKQHHYIGSNFFFAGLEAILLGIGTTFSINFKDQLSPV
jgi:transposase